MVNFFNTTAFAAEDNIDSAGGLAAIGVDAVFLAAQIVNFLLLFFILRVLLYKPILKVLNERKKTIEDGLALAEESTQKAEAASAKVNAMITEARIEAKEIIENSRAKATIIANEIEQKSLQNAEEITTKTKALLLEERNSIVESVEKEMANLLAKSMEKILKNKDLKLSDQDLVSALNNAKEDK